MKRPSLLLISGLCLLISPAIAIIDNNENGLSDLWEKQHNDDELFPETFDPQADPDQDGWPNAQEAAAGTDPFDPNPPGGFLRPEILHTPAVIGEENGQPIIITPEAVTVSWPTLVGKQYTLQLSPDLSENWITIDEPLIGDGDIHEFNFALDEADERKFYRVAVNDIDTDGDTLTDAEEHGLGTDSNKADTDGDGSTDDEEVGGETDPTNADTDNDTLADGIDADPTEALVDWKNASETRYLLIDIDAPAGQVPRDLNDKGEILFDGGIFADGQWTPMDPDGPVSGTYAREAGDEGTNVYASTLEYWNTFNDNRQLTGISGCHSSFTPDPESELGGGDRFLYSFLSWLQPQPQYTEEMTARLTGPWRWPNSLTPLGIAANGKMVSIIRYMEDVDPSPETEELEERTRLIIFPPDNAEPVVISPPENYLLTTNSYPDSKVTQTGWITSQSRKTVQQDPESDPEILHRVHLWKPDHTPVALPVGTMTAFQHRLNLSGLPNGRIGLVGVTGETADGTVILENPTNGMSHCESLSAHGIQFFSGTGTAITRDHKLWRNGKIVPLSDLCQRYGELLDTGWHLHPLKANKHGAYLIQAESSQGQSKTKVLIPVEIVPDENMSGVVGDVVKSAKAGSLIKHFVTPKANPPLVGPPDPTNQPYVILKAVGVTEEEITPGHVRQIVEWEGGETVADSPLRRRVKRDAASMNSVRIKEKDNGAVVAEMQIWVVWASCTSSRTEAQFYQNPPVSARFGSNLADDENYGIWMFKFVIEPAGICDTTNPERPDLAGNNLKDVPGASKPHPMNLAGDNYSEENPAPKADSASRKWDVSRQMEFTIQGPQGITTEQLEEIGCAESFSYPTDPVEGNDDSLIEDEDDNPYQVRAIDEFRLGHGIGELSSADAPRMSVLNAWAGAGRKYDEKFNFREFVRLEIWDGKRVDGKFWFKISPDYLWYHHMKAKSTGPTGEPWENDGSSAGLGNQN